MAKTVRMKMVNRVTSHVQTPEELSNLDWKHNRANMMRLEELAGQAGKRKPGRVTKQAKGHVWSVRNEKGPNQRKQGHQKI
jgi:hypothetical protein